MQPFPDLPPVAEAPALFESGHLWIQELVAGAPLRFRLEPTGTVTFADRERPLDGEPPPSLRAAVRHVRGELDRGALLDASDDPSGVVCYGVATRFEGVPYDWSRLPPYLGTDVWSASRGTYLPPDVVERTFDRLGLTAVGAFEKEVDARYFDPDDYESPGSAWYDGPAAGVVFRNKRGDRAARRDPGARVVVEELPDDAGALADAVVTPARVQRVAADLADPDFGAVFEGVLVAVAREEHARLPDALDRRAVRSAVAERVRALW